VLRTLDGDERLARYQPYHAARAELLRIAGDTAGADAALAVALELTDNERMRTALARRHAATG
jgi:RNA polymerase sigma-70 factor, ECF subfamily